METKVNELKDLISQLNQALVTLKNTRTIREGFNEEDCDCNYKKWNFQFSYIPAKKPEIIFTFIDYVEDEINIFKQIKSHIEIINDKIFILAEELEAHGIKPNIWFDEEEFIIAYNFILN